jgi:dienelactone hydrolase
MKPRIRLHIFRWLTGLGLLFAFSGIALRFSCRTAPLPLPDGVTLRTERVELTGKNVAVDLYPPPSTNPTPVVVVAHGFTRSHKNMAGWGGLLAANGFIAAVPDLPTFTDYRRNSRAIAELLAVVQANTFRQQPVATERGALVGYSMGGLSVLLAAAGNTNVQCLVDIDAVNVAPAGWKAAATLHIPCAVLYDEVPPRNKNRDTRSIIPLLPGPLFALQVKRATHCDPEHPSNAFGEFVCGKTNSARRAVFQQYALAALRSFCFSDRQAGALLMAATNDSRVGSVVMRKTEEFYPHNP